MRLAGRRIPLPQKDIGGVGQTKNKGGYKKSYIISEKIKDCWLRKKITVLMIPAE
jgi:hypothetical protein